MPLDRLFGLPARPPARRAVARPNSSQNGFVRPRAWPPVRPPTRLPTGAQFLARPPARPLSRPPARPFTRPIGRPTVRRITARPSPRPPARPPSCSPNCSPSWPRPPAGLAACPPAHAPPHTRNLLPNRPRARSPARPPAQLPAQLSAQSLARPVRPHTQLSVSHPPPYSRSSALRQRSRGAVHVSGGSARWQRFWLCVHPHEFRRSSSRSMDHAGIPPTQPVPDVVAGFHAVCSDAAWRAPECGTPRTHTTAGDVANLHDFSEELAILEGLANMGGWPSTAGEEVPPGQPSASPTPQRKKRRLTSKQASPCPSMSSDHDLWLERPTTPLPPAMPTVRDNASPGSSSESAPASSATQDGEFVGMSPEQRGHYKKFHKSFTYWLAQTNDTDSWCWSAAAGTWMGLLESVPARAA